MSTLLEESQDLPPPTHIVPAQPPPPIPSYTLRKTLSGVDTELLIQTFDDRVLVIVTQSGKVGCLTQASLPQVHPLLPPPSELDPTDPTESTTSDPTLSSLPPPPASLQLSPLLGAPPVPALHDLYVSQIATLVWWSLQLAGGARRNVVVGLALRGGGGEVGVSEVERERFAGVMGMVAGWPGP